MLARFYVVTDDQNPELHHEFNDEEMQNFVIQQAAQEGVLYHTEMDKIKILYDTRNGEVKLVDVDQKDGISFDYSNAFQIQRKQVELAIRRLAKLELLSVLYQLNDEAVCELIKLHHEIDSSSGKVRTNTSEIELDLTIVHIIDLGYTELHGGFSLRRWLAKLLKKTQTQIQRAIYVAFEKCKKESDPDSHILNFFKSRDSIQKFKQHIKEYLAENS